MNSVRKKYLFRLIFVNGSILLISLLYAAAFLLAQIFSIPIFDCIFKSIFHIYCPGCGGSRAVLSLLQFRFADAFFYSPVVITGVLLILYYDILNVFTILRCDETYIKFFRPQLLFSVVAVMLLTFLIRLILLLGFGVDPLGDFSVS